MEIVRGHMVADPRWAGRSLLLDSRMTERRSARASGRDLPRTKAISQAREGGKGTQIAGEGLPDGVAK